MLECLLRDYEKVVRRFGSRAASRVFQFGTKPSGEVAACSC